jgi:hypothetical protein
VSSRGDASRRVNLRRLATSLDEAIAFLEREEVVETPHGVRALARLRTIRGEIALAIERSEGDFSRSN